MGGVPGTADSIGSRATGPVARGRTLIWIAQNPAGSSRVPTSADTRRTTTERWTVEERGNKICGLCGRIIMCAKKGKGEVEGVRRSVLIRQEDHI